MGIGTAHRVVGLHPDLEVRALEGLHRQLHGGGCGRAGAGRNLRRARLPLRSTPLPRVV